MRILLAIVIANVVVMLADWFFFGVLWHKKYLAFPDVWRHAGDRTGERKAVALSTVVGALTPTVFIGLYATGLAQAAQAPLLAAAVWLMAAVPALVWNYLFARIHPLILVGGLLGWLVRLELSAGVVVAMLR
jgi:hypothetical protein